MQNDKFKKLFNKEEVKKIVAFASVVSLLVIATVVKASSSSSETQYQSWFDGVKKQWSSFVSGLAKTDSPPQVIKVVDEQSQVIDVVKNNSAAVVSIIASAEVPKYERCYKQAPFMNLPPEFQQFFNDQIPSVCQNGTEKQKIGAGSGFLVSSDGYIVTNKHVVAEPNAEYTVILNDEKNLGTKITAKVLARDPNNDIAILKIDRTGLPYVNLGDSSHLQVGQTVIAIGYALGEFDNTVSKGVVSGLSRNIEAGGQVGGVVESLKGLIQTDAAINPGNSGGPLLDISGNAIGMNTAMADAQGIGFAIPINQIKSVFDEVKQTGKISVAPKPYLGVRYIAIDQDLKNQNNLPFDYGMLVARGQNQGEIAVVPGSPADRAGIVENDIILEAGGKKLTADYLLSDALSDKKPGDSISFKIYHRGDIKDMKITLGKSS